jgi:TRAP transporter TAXI family solute receptor
VRHIEQLTESSRIKDLTIYYDVLGTGSIGGSFYTMGQGIARLIGHHTWIKPAVHVTGGGMENVRLAQGRRIVLGITQADTAANAFTGRGGFDFPHADLRALCCLHSLELQVSTLERTGLGALDQLRGRVVAVGAYGGASAHVSQAVLEQVGLRPNVDYVAQMHPFSTAVDMMRRGLVDAVAFLSVGQSPALLELAVEEPVRLLEIDPALVENLVSRYPQWHPSVIEAGTYPGQTSDVRTIGIPSVLVTHKDLPESDAYAVVSAILDHLDELQSVVYPGRLLSRDMAGLGIGIPFHPGAARYFAERLGNAEGIAWN